MHGEMNFVLLAQVPSGIKQILHGCAVLHALKLCNEGK